LAHGFGARQWAERWARGAIPGVINERLPYGYYHAADEGCVVEYSQDGDEGRVVEIVRLSLRHALGFDLIHAWRNRKGILGADVIWTHTELEHLAVLMLLQLISPPTRPRLIAQSVWLFDRWHKLSGPKRWLYRRLLEQADVLTVQSPDNLKIVRELFPRKQSDLVLFGINLELMVSPVSRPNNCPVRVISLGSDMHRDWQTLIESVKDWDRCEVRIASRHISSELIAGMSNVAIVQPKSAHEVSELYSWADLVVVSLKPNLHASGLTVIGEAVALGVPVICTDTGGLRAYFSDSELSYVPPGEPMALRRAIEQLGGQSDLRFSMARRAQAHMQRADLSSRSRARRLYQLSKAAPSARRGADQLPL
jgi:glycosyltransferase involved in cell wall biosynthesis